ncbi:NAD(P)H-hydrate dehydratase [Flavobacterium pectinovorum]|uniref:ADP-dependent (S)-NAD(P)H-hydrate dehydratase n=1 Tax=Flavobacterium pectinovorum TaxID=29533 RepID=A0AB36P476_9FLAO|nr:NAD(P)H-hydrate dehydratase [Flavobacterium pectinovorum]OXB06703.1 NAD(P)H-hydrate dehydratase [Flavobacterium pectinovorum]SHL42148.1 yjeF C-terminal region, hydroxyethylthiazole kinase-related [Flavobacterium pectinovorum]
MKDPFLITKEEILQLYKPVNPNTHKGLQGHAVIIAGSYGKIGAAVLASKSCLKTGCGLVTTFTSKCGYQILQISIPEVMVITDENTNFITHIHLPLTPQAIGIGPGIGKELGTQKALFEFLRINKALLVLDADALNILSENQSWLELVPENTILTPHPKELERLIGKWNSESEKFQKTIAFSEKYKVIIVMKGAPTYIINQSKIYENTTGNAALATAGSGDALTGILTSLLAQGYEPKYAAKLGVFLHGLTADIALPKTGYQSFTASDIIKNLGKAFLELDN